MEDRGKKAKKAIRKAKGRVVAEEEDADGAMGKPRPDVSPAGRDPQGKNPAPKRKRPVRERWLLTRKTWRYMADAGRRLIPDGAHNRPEDVPKIEAYFQEVCHREPRFLLWRKSSYPGALGFRAPRKQRRPKGGSCREKASSADEADELRAAAAAAKGVVGVATPSGSGGSFLAAPRPGGRFDLQRLRQEFLLGVGGGGGGGSGSSGSGAMGSEPPSPSSTDRPMHMSAGHIAPPPTPGDEEQERRWFIDTLCRYLNREESGDSGSGPSSEPEPLDFQMLVEQLRKHMSSMSLCSDSEEGGSAAGSSTSLHQQSQQSFSRAHATVGFGYDRGLEGVGSAGSRGIGSAGGRGIDSAGGRGIDSSGGRGIDSPVGRGAGSAGGVSFRGDPQQQLLDTFQRYYNKSTSRHKVISDLLTDRKLLEKLYFDLRKTRGFGSRSGGLQVGCDPHTAGLNYQLRRREAAQAAAVAAGARERFLAGDEADGRTRVGGRRARGDPPFFSSPPPLIEVQDEGDTPCDVACQTPPLAPEIFAALEDAVRREREAKDEEGGGGGGGGAGAGPSPGPPRRRSSVDHDDVSPSVSDTIKRYLRMARKKSLDADKADRFKRVNYDRNLRNIKAKGEITKPGDDDGLSKGAQTDNAWVDAMRELKVPDVGEAESRAPSSRSSIDEGSPGGLLSPPAAASAARGLLASGQTFLAGLLHGLQHAAGAGGAGAGAGDVSTSALSPATATAAAMQKSKSSSSVVHHGSRLVAKWRRSKSQGRGAPAPACTWTSQGHCTWSSLDGRTVTLTDVSLLSLSELERRVLCNKVALAKLQEINLGVNVRVPSESVSGPAVPKSKRRAYLIKRKALTTSIFDTARKDSDKDKAADGGLVFGIPLAQCLENDRAGRGGEGGGGGGGGGAGGPGGGGGGVGAGGREAAGLRRQSHHGSRASFTSLIDITSARPDESGSCESLAASAGASAGAAAGPRAAGSVPGLLDSLSSCGSASELLAPGADPEPAVPRVVAACFHHLERFGLDTLGLFRVSTSKKRVRQLREEFDCGKEVVLCEDHCPHDVATLLKEFFRDLPEPLLSRDLYHAFVQTQRIRNRRLQFEALQHLVELLPAANRDTLHALLTFLSTVAAHAGDRRDASGEWVPGNKMDTNNLATVFAPNILHCVKPGSGSKEISAERAEDRMDVINVVRAMIDHHRSLFVVPAETLDEVYLHMMDSHPDALEQLLRQRDAQADEFADELESGSEVTSPVEAEPPAQLLAEQAPRRVWSREEFLHETAATGGPDLAMRPNRHRERARPARKRWSEDSGGGGGVGAPGAAGGRRRATDPEARVADSPPPDPAVITASLKIPVPSALNLDDADIPFIEDGAAEVSRQQLTFGPGGLVRSGSATAAGTTRRRRQRTASGGSDSSQTSPLGGAQADSALGSSATYSSPPRNTPSLGSGSDGGLYSSPPSWASSPPTSPDAPAGAPVDFLASEDVASAKLSIATRATKAATTAGAVVTAKEMTPVILQKVTITSTSELKQVQRTSAAESAQSVSLGTRAADHPQDSTAHLPSSKDVRRAHRPDAPESFGSSAAGGSASSATASFALDDAPERQVDRKLTTSISSIGGAVMRSKTADIERMLRIQKAKPEAPVPVLLQTQQDKKKYTKRRYTDSRHQTRHIPDADALRDVSGVAGPAAASAAAPAGEAAARKSRAGPVWKRRELIASDPKQQHET